MEHTDITPQFPGYRDTEEPCTPLDSRKQIYHPYPNRQHESLPFFTS